MTLLSDPEKEAAAGDVKELILACGQEAALLRAVPGERLYGSDDASFTEVETFPLEFIETPPENLANKIDATACVLPALDVRPEDRVRSGADVFRVQTVVEERLFGVVTHKVLKLVRTAIGPVRIGRLEIGRWRELEPAEVQALIQCARRGARRAAREASRRQPPEPV